MNTLQDARYRYRDARENGSPFDVEAALMVLLKLEARARYGQKSYRLLD